MPKRPIIFFHESGMLFALLLDDKDGHQTMDRRDGLLVSFGGSNSHTFRFPRQADFQRLVEKNMNRRSNANA